MAYFVTILPPDSARSCVMQCTLPTQGMGSIISMVSINPEGFLPSILLLVVVIVVMIIMVEVVVMIIGVVVVGGGVSFIIKLSLVIIGLEAITFLSILLGNPPMKASRSFWTFGTMFGHKISNSWNLLIPGDFVGLLYSNRFGIGIPRGQGILSESTSSKFHFAILGTVTTRKYRFSLFKPTNEINSSFRTIKVERLATHKLLSDGDVVDLTSDEDPTDEDGDTRMGDLIGVSVSLYGEIFSGEKKSRESNIGDSDNTGDRGKTTGRAIIAWGGGIASYACLLYGSLCPGDLVGLLYSNRFGIGIPPGQGILSESTSRKFHFAVLGTVTTRKYQFSSFKPTNEINNSFRTIKVERLATHKLLTSRDSHGDNRMWDPIGGLVPLVDLTGDEDPTDKDRDTGMGDLTGV
uniref:Uncharacterized protein n=1 Tax=Tanacetum cinerariifolium TaxID=118510 RepID=A0A699GJS1_TANCI|nr:hypothetical protein [Tanacetum cinerariifolium]